MMVTRGGCDPMQLPAARLRLSRECKSKLKISTSSPKTAFEEGFEGLVPC